MLVLSQRHRGLMHAALAALVLGALSECAWDESRELTRRAALLHTRHPGLPLPIHAPAHDCGHESGCICRGATLVVALDAADFQPQALELLPLAPAPLSASLVDLADEFPPRLPADSMPPPITGRQLRALLASFLI
jgi:hypothetical protein